MGNSCNLLIARNPKKLKSLKTIEKLLPALKPILNIKGRKVLKNPRKWDVN